VADQPTAGALPTTAAAAPDGAKLTLVAGTTTFAAVVVNGGAVATLTELPTRFSPELVIDYAPGGGDVRRATIVVDGVRSDSR
jgi:hypothetical protein